MSDVHGQTGGNPLEHGVEGGAGLFMSGREGVAAKPSKKRKGRPIRQFTPEQWADVVRKVEAHRVKGWGMARIARNMNLSVYRVRQALKSPGHYSPALRNTDGSVVKGGRIIHSSEMNGDLQCEVIDPAPQQTRPTASGGLMPQVQELLDLLPQMSDEAKKFWLREIVELI